MILKFQQGGTSGGGMPPFFQYTPVITPQPELDQTAAGSTKSGTSDELGLKDLLGMIKELDGLPNDAAALAKSLTNLFKRSEQTGTPLSSSDIASAYTSYLAQIRRAKFNKEAYDNTYKIVKDNGGLNEIAITNAGNIVAQDIETGEIVQLTPNEARTSNKYRTLTNSNLLAIRAQSPDQTFDNTVLSVVENGIGLETVHKLIKDSLANLGTDEISLSGYSRTEKQRIKEGIDYIKQAVDMGADISGMTIEGLYENNILNKTQAIKAQQALQYVYSMLPQNAKALLEFKAGSPDKAVNLVMNYITAGTSSTIDWDTKMVKDKDGNSLTGEGSGDKNIDLDPVKAFVLGMGHQQPISINVGNSYTHQINGRFGILTDKTGKALGANSTFTDVTNSAYAGVLDMNNATFGGVKLNTTQGNKILLDSSDIIGMDLPVDQNALSKGIIRPDLYLLARLEEAESEIRYNNITDPEQINAIFQEFDLPPKFVNENGEYQLNQLEYRRFARLSGLAEESALPEDSELDNSVIEIEDENERNSIEEILQKNNKEYSMSGGIFGWGATNLYKGAIYIPVREDIIAASLGSGEYYTVPNSDAISTEMAWNQNKRTSNYKKPPTLSALKQ